MAVQPHFFDFDPPAFEQWVQDEGMPRFRARQIMEWIYRHGVADPAAMTNLSRSDRARLGERLRITSGRVVQTSQASDGVRKLLMSWDVRPHRPKRGVAGSVAGGSGGVLEVAEGPAPPAPSEACATAPLQHSRSPTWASPALDDPTAQTECVMIPAEGRRTACISSQVGCPVGCRFCASGLGGLDGNLSSGQIVEQVWRLQHPPENAPPGERITNVVFMGMGEPLANFNAVTDAIRRLVAPWGMNLSARRVTLSTVGLPAQIRRLADADLPPITLAISLHAPNDEIRRRIIPWADFVPIARLLDAARHYFKKTGREITIEYILLRDVNDRPEHAAELSRLARSLRCHVNLIRYNEVEGLAYGRPAGEAVHAFQRVLREAGVNVHIRASRGRDIAAACGQLRHEQTAAS